MRHKLTSREARVIGSLIEKAITTPDQYPLSLNAVTLACNQKSNRDPVMHLDEAEVQDTLDQLKKKYLVSDHAGFGSRVAKYQHRFCNNEFGGVQLSDQELGIVCVLLLRGPQTPGELRTRTNRLCEFSDVHQAEVVLEQLMSRSDGPFVARLPREPGKRESRYIHLLGDDAEDIVEQIEAGTVPTTVSAAAPAAARGRDQRVEELETLVLELREELDALRVRVERLEE